MNNELIDFSYLKELSGNDQGYISEVINLFLGTMPEGLAQLETLARTTEDWDAIYRQAHFLKSSVSVIRVRDMFDKLSKIEAHAKAHDKAQMIAVLDEVVATYREAHPILLAERDKGGGSKI